MPHHKRTKIESLPPQETEPKLLKEDIDDSKQEIEKTEYSVGLNRESDSEEDEDDLFQARIREMSENDD